MLLVPADPLRPRQVDGHFGEEAEAARTAGLTVAVVDHDALADANGAERAVARVPAGGTAVYRGWMLRSERYAAFEVALARRGVRLRTTAAGYRRGHELPGWYPALARWTPESVWTDGTGRAEFESACEVLGRGPGVLRDYCKSMKHHWDEAMFIPDIADHETAWTVADRYRQLRDDEFVGGFVLRRFEPFTGAEVRTWWVAGHCRLATAHPDTPAQPPPTDLDVHGLGPTVAALGLPFVTVDLARRTDGEWRVVELGDGQVSDRPATTPAADLIAAITDPQWRGTARQCSPGFDRGR